MGKRKKYKKIILPYGGMKRMAVAIGCDRTTIEEALRFARDTELQNQIRREALQAYGGKMVEF